MSCASNACAGPGGGQCGTTYAEIAGKSLDMRLRTSYNSSSPDEISSLSSGTWEIPVYTSDDRGYGDVYLVDLPGFDDLLSAETNPSGR